MRICTFSLGGDPRVGVLFGEQIADLTLAFALSLKDADPAEAIEAAEELVAPTCEELLEDSETTRLIADSAIKALRALKRKNYHSPSTAFPLFTTRRASRYFRRCRR